MVGNAGYRLACAVAVKPSRRQVAVATLRALGLDRSARPSRRAAVPMNGLLRYSESISSRRERASRLWHDFPPDIEAPIQARTAFLSEAAFLRQKLW
jgi:hypothetical protein